MSIARDIVDRYLQVLSISRYSGYDSAWFITCKHGVLGLDGRVHWCNEYRLWFFSLVLYIREGILCKKVCRAAAVTAVSLLRGCVILMFTTYGSEIQVIGIDS